MPGSWLDLTGLAALAALAAVAVVFAIRRIRRRLANKPAAELEIGIQSTPAPAAPEVLEPVVSSIVEDPPATVPARYLFGPSPEQVLAILEHCPIDIPAAVPAADVPPGLGKHLWSIVSALPPLAAAKIRDEFQQAFETQTIALCYRAGQVPPSGRRHLQNGAQ